MHSLRQKKVVTSFIRHRGKLLLLRRSSKVRTYQGRWAGISGYLEESTPLAQALKEIYEETGLDEKDVQLFNAGAPFEVIDHEMDISWMVHPFLFDTDAPEKIKLDWEHVALQWVKPHMLKQLPTVPMLAEAYKRCLQTGHAGC